MGPFEFSANSPWAHLGFGICLVGWLGGKLELGSHFQPMGPLEEYSFPLVYLQLIRHHILMLTSRLVPECGRSGQADLIGAEKPMPYNAKLKDYIRQKCTEMEKVLEMMKQAWESQQKITEQIMHLTKRSERWQKQMVHLLLLEASLDWCLQRQEELMAAQEWNLWDLVVKIVDKRGGATSLVKLAHSYHQNNYKYCMRCPTGDICMVNSERTYKSPEFMPSSADEEFGPPNDSPKPKPKPKAAAAESKITTENINIGKGSLVYDPRQPRKRIGAVVKVKARQHGEVDDYSHSTGSKPLRVELQQIVAKTAKLEVKYAVMAKKMQDCQHELHAALIRTCQEGLLGTYEAIKTCVAQLTFKQEKLKVKLGDKV
ncbi:hypothetical protein BS17DRAFT_768141 [Gyrodon lividus]|nr:hypothetical protein BS17DRAFT_768141 [Gyrodon lividus]